MKKPCKSCGGSKKSLGGTITSILQLGGKPKQTVVSNTVEKNGLINDADNTPPNPVLTSPSIILPNLEYKRIGRLQFPSRT